MRTPVVSLLCGLLALTSGAAVTNRVKIAVAVPAAAVVKSVTVASNAVPASTSVVPVSPVPLAQKIEIILAAIGPVDTASVAAAFVEAIGSATEAEIAAAIAVVHNRTTPAEFVTIISGIVNGIPPGRRLSVLVAALGTCHGAEAVRALLPVISAIDAGNEDIVVIVSVMEAMARAVRADVPVSIARAAKESKRIDTPAWYDIRLYDGGTGLWAIATKAKWYAEHGDREKVDQLYAYFLKVMSNVESKR